MSLARRVSTAEPLRCVTPNDMTEESYNLAAYIARSIHFQGKIRTSIPDARLFGPRISSKDPFLRGVPEAILEGVIEFTYRYSRPPTELEFFCGCVVSQPHPAWNKNNVAHAQRKLLYHEWTSPGGSFVILDDVPVEKKTYLRITERAISYASEWQDDLVAQIKENMGEVKLKDFRLRYLNSIVGTKGELQDRLEELRAINRAFFGKFRSVRVRRL